MNKLRKLSIEEHKQLALLLEMTRLFNMYEVDKYSTKVAKAKSRETKIMKLIDELKNLLDDQVVMQYARTEKDTGDKLIKIYYGKSEEAKKILSK